MNFFEHQDKARSSTARLVLLFVVAIVALVVMTSYPAAWLLAVVDAQQAGRAPSAAALRPAVLAGVALVIIAVVLLGALYRLAQLRSGGRAIADSMGGKLLTRHQPSADELKILNVVEEMAIASGLPVPPVYLIEDDAINAFAAGYRQQDAVIGITRGAIRLLDRDELQGVIAHEFSHIFNGDMRLNLRLVGWLHGLLLIALLGRGLLRVPRSMNRRRNQSAGAIVGLGLLFTVLGYAGVLFGNLIKSAVSRQREFLADASAVQFTRNPPGIANALKKIGGFPLGSRLLRSDAGEISHMLFGEGVMKRNGAGWFATHPPLADRIRRIDPQWNGELINPETLPERSWSTLPPEEPPRAQPHASAEVLVATVLATVGNASVASLGIAQSQLAALPLGLRQALDTTLEAMLFMYALVIADAAADTARMQLALLQQALPAASFKLLAEQLKLARQQPRASHLLLIALAQPALKQLSAGQLDEFRRLLEQLAMVDGVLSLREWSLCALLQHYLDMEERANQRHELSACSGECRLLLAALAQGGQQDVAAATQAFAAAWKLLDMVPVEYAEVADFRELTAAVTALRCVRPLQKPALLKAMVVCVQHDGTLNADEQLLLRTVAAVLDCPVPPLAA